MSKIPILLPVEISSRELDYKIFVGCLALNSENRVFIGQHDVVFRLSQYLQGGVYIGKNIFLLEWPLATLDRYESIKRNGFVYIHLDEEGAVWDGLEPEWRNQLSRRVDPRCLAREDYMCTWGDFQRDYYKSFGPDCADHIVTTGYPKFDLYKAPYNAYYAADTSSLRDTYGPFILVNTNFGLVNYQLGTRGIFAKEYGYDVEVPEKRARFLKLWAHNTAIYARFVRLIGHLSIAFPKHTLVVRPHPTEDSTTYEDIFRGVENVKVVHQGTVVPWLLAGKVLVHNGCTTAIEAHFLGSRIVNFKPVNDAEADLFLPNVIGTTCTTEEEVAEQVASCLDEHAARPVAEPLPPRARKLLANLDTSDGLHRLVEVIAGAQRTVSERPVTFRSAKYATGEALQRAYDLAKDVVRPLFPEKQRRYKFLVSDAMFARFRRSDIEARTQNMSRVVGKRIHLSFHGLDLFSLEEVE